MSKLLGPGQRAFITTALMAMAAGQIQSCGVQPGSSSPVASATGGTSAAEAATGGTAAGGSATGGSVAAGGTTTSGTTGNPVSGGSPATGGMAASGGSSTAPATGGANNGNYVVAMVQSSEAQATDITQDEIETMVTDAVTQAGGLDFITDGMTVVLKPNLLTHLAACWSGTATLPSTVNGVATDWRVTKAVADLVRAKNPSGQILVMEGSNRSTTAAFTALGYTSANFGSSVDAFIALEGTSCDARNVTTGLIQKPGMSGTQYWINAQYFNADILISIGAMKTHWNAGTTGCVKNLGIGATPNAMYSATTTDGSCTRNYNQSTAANYIDHSTPAALGSFVSDYYSVRPADFAVMDGLQGMQNGPCSTSASDKMNMRLILASKNAVALDTIQALVMGCDPTKVPALTKAAAYGLGTTDSTEITVNGVKEGSTTPITVNDVKKAFTNDTTTYPQVAGICN